MSNQTDIIAALRKPIGSVLPQALAAFDQPFMLGLLRVIRITPDRYERELQRCWLDVYKVGGVYLLELPVGREGPWTDLLCE